MTKLKTDESNLPVYQDAVRYDAEHWWKVDDYEFWTRMSDKHGPKVLELACGTGRLAVELMNTAAIDRIFQAMLSSWLSRRSKWWST